MNKTKLDAAIVETCERWYHDLSTVEVSDIVWQYIRKFYPEGDYVVEFNKIFKKYIRRNYPNIPTVS